MNYGSFSILVVSKTKKGMYIVAASMKWTMIDNTKAVVDIWQRYETSCKRHSVEKAKKKKINKKNQFNNNRAIATIMKTCTQHPPSMIDLNKKNLKTKNHPKAPKPGKLADLRQWLCKTNCMITY